MDIIKAKEIVSALAEGIDPTTGELLPEKCVYNKGDIVRALYAVLNESNQTKKTTKNSKKNIPEEYDCDLFDKLKKLRNEIAEEKGVFPYQVAVNASLQHMAANMPTTKEAFLQIYGVGKYTASQYGDRFIREIKKHIGNE